MPRITSCHDSKKIIFDYNLRTNHRIFQTYFDKGLVDNLNNQFTSAGHSRRYQYAESLEKKNRKKKQIVYRAVDYLSSDKN